MNRRFIRKIRKNFNIRNFFSNKKYPLRTPKFVGGIDKNDPKPGRNDFFNASGIFLIGKDKDGNELWITARDAKTHMLIYGTIGSGKTISLQSLATNAFLEGTGLSYIDPRGDPSLIHNLFQSARRFGREDDFLVLDFMRNTKKPGTSFKLSNTINPFTSAPADVVTNILISLLPQRNNSVFEQKAIGLLMTLIPVLAALRDANVSLPITDINSCPRGSIGKGLSISMIHDYFDPMLCTSLVYPVDNKSDECDTVAKLVDARLLDRLKAVLTSLNYRPGKNFQDQKTFFEQFGYAKGYFGAPLSSISGMYGHLFNVSSGEIDMYDCLFNRRILVGTLPALEKSPQECENLGKIILASIKNSVSGGLTDRLGSKTKEIIGARPSSSDIPAIIIVDEYAAIMMPGFEIILTQARSLGFMVIVASQDYEGMKGRDSKSCDQIVENTKTKIFMTQSVSGTNQDLLKNIFGSIKVEEANLNDPEKRGKIIEICRVEPNDLTKQTAGEFHLVFEGKIYKGSTYYLLEPYTEQTKFRINQFLQIPSDENHIRENIEKWLKLTCSYND